MALGAEADSYIGEAALYRQLSTYLL